MEIVASVTYILHEADLQVLETERDESLRSVRRKSDAVPMEI